MDINKHTVVKTLAKTIPATKTIHRHKVNTRKTRFLNSKTGYHFNLEGRSSTEEMGDFYGKGNIQLKAINRKSYLHNFQFQPTACHRIIKVSSDP